MIPQNLVQLKSDRTQALAFVTLCLALLSVSFAPIFIRWSETDLGANGTVFNRLFFFVVFFGTGKLISQRLTPAASTEEALPFTRRQWLLLGSVGVVSITSLVLWAISLEYTTVAKSMLLNNLTPIFTTLGSWLFLRRQFDNKFLIGMAIALAGAIALGLEDLNDASAGSLTGDIYALLSAIFLGTYFLIVEQLRFRFSATTILLWRCIIGSILLLPVVLLVEGQLFPTTTTAWLAAIGLGVISEGLGQRLLAESMDKFSSSFVSLFLLLEPIVSAMLAWAIFLEAISPVTWLGFAVVLSGIYLAQSSQAATQKDLQPASGDGSPTSSVK
ncbi:DMT family transporter [Geitlerinema sp. PCC 9228]|jgi:drug/metabolite transporter (DMT)-like permease|uniref:DMT family transporter n=1 Tax=Geitlerinema sp. PCC 9228 TaxID=111611 RepID=UPI0008F9B0C8|nr:DMT family transporter [Geitlerinema sp. PCC 9228]